MSDAEIRAEQDSRRARAWALRYGQPLTPEIGDLIELGIVRDYRGDVFSNTFMGQECPVRGLVVGFRNWKHGRGRSPVVLGLPPLMPSPHVASLVRVTRVLEVGYDVSEFQLGKGDEE